MKSSQSNAEVAQLRGVTKVYPRGVVALKGIDLDLRAGEITTLLGPNGAGKTTAIKILLGLAAPTSGTAMVFGGDPRKATHRTRTGAMMQVAKVPETLRVKEHIQIFRSYYPNPLAYEATLHATGIEALEKRLFGTLSGGEKQRVMLALALCGNPDLLFLDEPTVGLDVDSRHMLWQCIRNARAEGRAVLLTTHYLEEAEMLADRVVVINHGAVIADGSVTDIRKRVGLKRIRCHTSLALPALTAMRDVASVRAADGSVEIMTSQAESVARELLSRDDTLSNLEIMGAGLEAAFLELTRENAAGAA
jgi:ABC-2 type transport system ATP-binding protein